VSVKGLVAAIIRAPLDQAHKMSAYSSDKKTLASSHVFPSALIVFSSSLPLVG